MFRADLHCHSTCSDGTSTPEQLIEQAKKIGLSGLSITDHDTIEAYHTASGAAKKAGILLGTGVEFSCTHQDQSVHLLGYDYLLNYPEIQEFCLRHRNRRKDRNRKILQKLKGHGFIIKEEEIEELEEKEKTVGRPHIAELMVKKGYAATIKEAFDRHLGDGKCCYDPGVPISLADTIAMIHRAGGKAFLAHPHLYDRQRFVKQLLQLGFDGIECFYAKFAPDEERRWTRVAKEHGLLISGGSDFHGEMKPHITLGCSWVDEEAFHKIFQNLV